jgi:hypothetical protein
VQAFFIPSRLFLDKKGANLFQPVVNPKQEPLKLSNLRLIKLL